MQLWQAIILGGLYWCSYMSIFPHSLNLLFYQCAYRIASDRIGNGGCSNGNDRRSDHSAAVSGTDAGRLGSNE